MCNWTFNFPFSTPFVNATLSFRQFNFVVSCFQHCDLIMHHQNMHTYEFRILTDIENHKIHAQEINLNVAVIMLCATYDH